MNRKFGQFGQLMLVQFREFFREPEVLFWSIAFPILMAWVLGMAFSGEREPVRNVGWILESGAQTPDSANSKLYRKIVPVTAYHAQYNKTTGSIAAVISSKGIAKSKYQFLPTTKEEGSILIKKGIASILVYDTGDSLIFRFDPKNSEAYLTYLQLDEALQNDNDKRADSERIEKFEERGMRYIDFLIPGLLATNIMNSGLWGICYALIEKRSKKLLRRMVATPMSKSAFLASYVLGRIILGIFEALVLIFFAWMYFGCTIQGSIAAFVLLYLTGNICFSGIAILLSIRTDKTQLGNGLISVIQLPMMICSGVFFSYHSFPDAMIKVIKYLPLTLLADGIRSVFNEGAGFYSALPAAGIMTLMGAVLFGIGVKLYKWY